MAVVLLAAVVGRPAPAGAHPFGPPPTATVSAEGRRITLDWSATPDDAVAIGELLGVMPAGSTEAYRQESAAQVAPSAADEARLSGSPRLRQYLVNNIAVIQDGNPCRATVPAIPDFVHAGARIVLDCPAVVEQVDLRITMLHDVNDAYRTFAVGESTAPGQSVFTVAEPQHTWRFGVEATGGGTTPTLLAVIAATLVAGAAVLLLVRRRKRGT